jgi:hypothetical protein
MSLKVLHRACLSAERTSIPTKWTKQPRALLPKGFRRAVCSLSQSDQQEAPVFTHQHHQ